MSPDVGMSAAARTYCVCMYNETFAPQDGKSRYGLTPGLKSETVRAAEVGVHRITLLRARQRGELAYLRVGDRILYTPEHITEWLERCERPAKAA